MKLKHIKYWLIIGSLLLLSVYLNIKNIDFKKEILIERHKFQSADRSYYRLKQGITALYQLNTNKLFSENILNNSLLKKEVDTGGKIIFLMQRGTCSFCIFTILQDLSILEEKIGTGFVLIATNIEEEDQPYEFQGFNFPTFFVDTFFLPKEISKEPIVLIAEDHKYFSMFFLPELLPELRQQYFNDFLPIYFGKYNTSN